MTPTLHVQTIVRRAACLAIRRYSVVNAALQRALQLGDAVGSRSSRRRSERTEALRPVLEQLTACSDDELRAAVSSVFTTTASPKAEPIVLALLQATAGSLVGIQLLQLLCDKRLNGLGTNERGILVCALRTVAQGQRGAMYSGFSEAWCRVLLDTRGHALTLLKDGINIASSSFDMHQLVLRDTHSELQRAQLISHFARHAQAEHNQYLSQQVMSDYDDTVQAMWIERRLPLGTVYPGAIPFLAALQQGSAHVHGHMSAPMWWDRFAAGTEFSIACTSSSGLASSTPVRFDADDATDPADTPSTSPPGSSTWLRPLRAAVRISSSVVAETQAALDAARTWLTASAAGDALRSALQQSVTTLHKLQGDKERTLFALPSSIVFVTARPADPRSIVKRRTLENLRSMPFHHVIVLLGSLLRMTSINAMAGKKVDNVLEYHMLFPEHAIVFVGDSGQGDAAVAARLRRHPLLRATAFIHDLDANQPRTGDGGVKDEYRATGIHFYRNYVQAASLALHAGLLSPQSACVVAASALREMQLRMESHVDVPPPQVYAPDGIPLQQQQQASADADWVRQVVYCHQLLHDAEQLEPEVRAKARDGERSSDMLKEVQQAAAQLRKAIED